MLALALVGGCTNAVQDLAASNGDVEEHIAAQCHRWHERANRAAHPDPETIARHDQLERKAAELMQQGAIDAAAQDQIEAAALYDSQSALKDEADCWGELRFVEEQHGEMIHDLAQTANEMTTSAAAQPAALDPSIYTLRSQPPPPPQPNPMPLAIKAPASLPNADTVPQARELGAFVGTVPGGPNVYVVPPGAGP